MTLRLRLIIVCLVAGMSSGELVAAYKASNASKHGPRFGTFTSKNANTAVKRLQGSEAANARSTYPLSNFNFLCPGYSFLTGISSKYEVFDSKRKFSSTDRSFSFRCSFFEDEKKRLIRKANCRGGNGLDSSEKAEGEETKAADGPKKALEKVYDNEAEKTGTSRCSGPDVFLAGLTSERYRQVKYSSEEERDSAKKSGLSDTSFIFSKDRAFESTCCQLNDFDGNNLTTTACETKTVKANTSFSFDCRNGKILHEMRTEFFNIERNWDRSYTFTCCTAESKS